MPNYNPTYAAILGGANLAGSAYGAYKGSQEDLFGANSLNKWGIG
jgi:hypothetical protein